MRFKSLITTTLCLAAGSAISAGSQLNYATCFFNKKVWSFTDWSTGRGGHLSSYYILGKSEYSIRPIVLWEKQFEHFREFMHPNDHEKIMIKLKQKATGMQKGGRCQEINWHSWKAVKNRG